MKRIRVAVLDSGIAEEIIDCRIKEKKQIYYDYCESRYVYNDKTIDYNGHGTAFVDTMWGICPTTDLYIVKILGISGRSSDGVFLEALKYAETLPVDIIAIPSSYVQENISNEVYQICDRISEKGVIIVAAVKNGEDLSHIADYKSVIGVKGMEAMAEDYFFSRFQPIQMICNSEPIVVRTANGIRKVFQGNSKATAIATGIIAKCLTKYSREDLFSALEKNGSVLSSLRKHDYFDVERECYYCENDENYQRLIYLLCDYFFDNSTNHVRKEDLLLYKDRFLFRGLDLLIQLLEERFDKKLERIKLNDLRWAYLFYERYLRKQ